MKEFASVNKSTIEFKTFKVGSKTFKLPVLATLPYAEIVRFKKDEDGLNWLLDKYAKGLMELVTDETLGEIVEYWLADDASKK